MTKGLFGIGSKSQSYHWYRACKVGGSSPWRPSPSSRWPTAGRNGNTQNGTPLRTASDSISSLGKPPSQSPEIGLQLRKHPLWKESQSLLLPEQSPSLMTRNESWVTYSKGLETQEAWVNFSGLRSLCLHLSVFRVPKEFTGWRYTDL